MKSEEEFIAMQEEAGGPLQPAAARVCHGKVAWRLCTVWGSSEVRNGNWEPWEALVPVLRITLFRRDEEAREGSGHHLTIVPLFLLSLASLRPWHALELLLWRARLVVDKRRKA